jgi:hypothetical protein
MSTNEYSIRTIERERMEAARRAAQQRAADIERRLQESAQMAAEIQGRLHEESVQKEAKRQKWQQRVSGQANDEQVQIGDIQNYMDKTSSSLERGQITGRSTARQMQHSNTQLSNLSADVSQTKESASELGNGLTEVARDMHDMQAGAARVHEKAYEGIGASREFASNINEKSPLLGKGLQDKSGVGGGEEIRRLQHERNVLQMPLAPIALLYIQAAEKIGYSLNDAIIGNDIEMTFTGSGDLDKAPVIVKLPSSLDEASPLEWPSQIFVDANGDAICHDIIEQVQKNLNDAGIKGKTWSTGKPDSSSNRQRYQTRDNRKIREE